MHTRLIWDHYSNQQQRWSQTGISKLFSVKNQIIFFTVFTQLWFWGSTKNSYMQYVMNHHDYALMKLYEHRKLNFMSFPCDMKYYPFSFFLPFKILKLVLAYGLYKNGWQADLAQEVTFSHPLEISTKLVCIGIKRIRDFRLILEGTLGRFSEHCSVNNGGYTKRVSKMMSNSSLGEW